MNKINEIDEELELTPKGIALLSMLYCGLITDIDDPRFKGFWTLFENDMKESGYIIDDNGSNKIVKENTNTYKMSESEKILRAKIAAECIEKGWKEDMHIAQSEKYDFTPCPDAFNCLQDYTFSALCDEVTVASCEECWKNFLRGAKC